MISTIVSTKSFWHQSQKKSKRNRSKRACRRRIVHAHVFCENLYSYTALRRIVRIPLCNIFVLFVHLIVPHCTLLYLIVSHCISLHRIVPFRMFLYLILPHSTTLYLIVHLCNFLYLIVSHCTLLYLVVPHFTILYLIVSHTFLHLCVYLIVPYRTKLGFHNFGKSGQAC